MEEKEILAREKALWSLQNVASAQPDGAELPPSTSRNKAWSSFPNVYACDVCGETFVSTVKLKKHHRFHSLSRPYQCGICGLRFVNNWTLHNHQHVHTGKRRIPCERCVLSFCSQHNLKRHMTIHEKEEMYRCQACGVLFCQEHEYNLAMFQLSAAVPPVVTQTPILPTAVPVKLPVDIQVPLADDRPSSSSAIRIIKILEAKKKKKKQSLFDVSRNIAGLPLLSPTKKKHEHDVTLHVSQQLYDYRRREEANTGHRKAHQMQRVAYDIEVVL